MTDEELSSNAENDSVLHGFVKWFNIAKGFGFITRNDGGEDVFVHQSAIKSIGYRTLAEGEQVTFKITDSDKGQIAVCVTSKSSGDVKGATRRNRTKQGARKYTSLCFNCNKGGHKAKKCPYERTTDRTCHKCGSNMHIIRKCPLILANVKENKDNGLTKDGQRKSGPNYQSEESSTEINENEKVIDINHNHEPLS